MLNKVIILLIGIQTILGVKQNEDQTKAMEIVLKFAEFTTWNRQMSEDFIVLVAENDDSKYEKIKNYFENQKFEDKTIKTIKLTNETLITEADVIFISNNTDINFEKLSEKIKEKQILTITTDKNMLSKGCMFYIKIGEQGVEYLYNRHAVIKSGLMIQGSLLAPVHEWN
ncbi:MAG: YfiR family protein [Bacteroidales bacterium]|jgi:hypothetical protein|nr:YfiR family protein [Bacteroidales bacterium]